MIQRDILETLEEWKKSPRRKPAVLLGARQIGKSVAMREFGKKCYEYVAEFNFDKIKELSLIFEKTQDIKRIIEELGLYSDVPILPGRTLLIFDEIQECGNALNSLKYFCEDAPELHVIAAGSLLGVAVNRKQMSVPVGKVKIIRMYPLTFREFLRAASPKIYDYIESVKKFENLPAIMMSGLELEYKRYMACGGMPEAVSALLDGDGMSAVDDILSDILALYEVDFSKYVDSFQVPRISALWHSLPSQLSKENRKFIYSVVKTGARAREYEDGLLWLERAGLIYRVFNVSKPFVPLSGYKELSAFKVYAIDCGLLRRLAGLSPSVILQGSGIYTEFKGALSENAILQSLVAQSPGTTPYYWSSNGSAEVEFLLEKEDSVIPVEVKADKRISGKSLSVYSAKFSPRCRIRFSMNNLKENDGLLSIPSPMADWLPNLLE